MQLLQLQGEWSIKHEKLDIGLVSPTPSKEPRQPLACQAVTKSDTQATLLTGGRFENAVSRMINRGQNAMRVLKEYVTGPCQLRAAAHANKELDTKIDF